MSVLVRKLHSHLPHWYYMLQKVVHQRQQRRQEQHSIRYRYHVQWCNGYCYLKCPRSISTRFNLVKIDLVETLILFIMDIWVCVYNVYIEVSPPSSLSSTGSMENRKPIVSSKCRIYPSVTELYWQLYVRTTMNNSIRFLVLIFSKLCSSWVLSISLCSNRFSAQQAHFPSES